MKKKRKIILQVFIMIILLLMPYVMQAQNQKVKLAGKNITLKMAFEQIEKQTGLSVDYDANVLDVNKVLILVPNSNTLNEVLTQLFKGTNYEYSIDQSHVIITVSSKNKLLTTKKAISGLVSDNNGNPLPGVTVVIKGTTTGTISDSYGKYNIAQVPSNAMLRFSFIGMQSREVSVFGKEFINVTMEDDAVGLKEVVAIGYGTMRKNDLTGSITSVNMKGAEMSANTSIMQALQGSAAGINVGAVTSAGESPTFSIRGQTSLSADGSPLVVLDGIIFNGSLSDLNTNDVERIDILKDASATAVYGSRSANGVVLVTTKKGTSEKPVFNLNIYHGVQQISNKVKMEDADAYVQKLLDWRSATSLESNPNNVSQYLQPLEVANYQNHTSVDWIDLVTRTAPISQYELSVSGKSKSTNYYLSGAYTEQEGIVVGDDFKRTSLRANFSNDINEWMTVGMKTSFAHKDYSGEQANLEMAVLASPLATVYANKETGELNLYPQTDQLVINPLSYTNAQDQEIYDNLFAILYTDIKIPKIEGLTFHFDYSNTLEFGKHNQFWGTNTVSGLLAPNGKASKDNSEERDWSINSILSYSRKFKEKHRIDATLLYTSEKRNAEASEMLASNFFTSVLKWDNMGIGKIQSNTSTAWQESSTGLMARVAYAFDQKYLVTATIRRDGFSGFSQNHKYADFPSLSVGWVASEESFLKNVDWLSFLKLRLSYGVNGNQALGRYGSLAQVGQVQYVYGDGGGTSVGIYPSTLANADLGWEKTKSINLGLNINVLKNRISTEFDFYTTKTNDLLVQQSLPEVSGYKSVWTNLGEIQNKGFEATLNTVNITNQDLRWESKFTFSLNRNKIVHLYGVDNDGDGFEDSDIGNKWFIGKSLGAIYDYKINGIYQTGDTDIPSGFYPGYFKIKDTDGVDGITPDDRTIVGNTSPNYRFSIYNGLTYKNFSLSFLINSVQGGGKNNYYLGENSPSLNPNYSFPDRLNIPDINYWTPDNPTNTTPIINYKAKYFHGMYQDRSFVRLQDVTLAYTLKPSRFMGQSSLKIYVSGKNLYTWTKWTGWDPEAGTTAGGDYYQYSSGGNTGNPVMRSFIAGIIFGF